MKILSFIHAHDLGGVERVALRLANAWHSTDHRLKVLLGRRSDSTEEGALALNYDYPRFNAAWSAPVETPWMMLRLALAIRRLRPDVLFCAGNTYAVVAVTMKLLYGRRCPPILAKISNDLVRDDLPYPFQAFYRLWVRLQGSLIDHFVAPAGPMRAQLIQSLGIGPDRISVINNPVLDGPGFQAFKTAGQRRLPPVRGRRFIAVGRLAKQKNFHLLLRAFARGADAADTLTLLGDGPERARLTALAGQLGIASRVTMPGHVADTASWFGQSDILVLSSDYEGLPAVIVEALAAGLTLIATECSPNIPMLLGHGVFGEIVPPRDVDRLASAIARACLPGAHRDAASRHASQFTVAAAAPDFLQIMDRLTKTAAGRKKSGGGARRLRVCNEAVVFAEESGNADPV